MRRTVVIGAGGDYFFNVSSSNEFLIIRESDSNVVFAADNFTPLELSRGDNVNVKRFQMARTKLSNPNDFDITVEYQLSDVPISVPPKMVGIDGSVGISSIESPIAIQRIIEKVTVKAIESIVNIKGKVNVDNKLDVDVKNTVEVSGNVKVTDPVTIKSVAKTVSVNVENKQLNANIINHEPIKIESDIKGVITSTNLTASYTFKNEKVYYLKLIANSENKGVISFLGLDINAGSEFVIDTKFVCNELISILEGDSCTLIKVS